MLDYYYDCLAKEDFDELFGGLYVGTHPTENRNSYLVLKISFSGITANPEKMENDFEQYGCLVLDSFSRKYRTLFSDDFVEKVAECPTVKSKLVCICLSMQAQGLKMYLILDEYDNFANNVLSSYGNPAVEIAKTDNFKSLLFYYGMLTINRVEMGDLFLAIPNQVVREQLYGYLVDVYRDVASMELDVSDLNQLMKRMAYLCEWENYFQYIADQLKAQSSIREFMEGEAHVKGFLLSYMGMNSYYMTFPEYEMNKGFSDFFMQPNLYQLPDMPYSYVIEVKYCPRDAADTEIEKLLEDAKVQLTRYVECPKVQAGKGTTEVIKIALVFRGWDLEKFVRVTT